MIQKSKKLLFTCLATTLLSTASQADFLGAEVGYAAWAPELTGDVRKGTGTLDFENDLGYGSKETNGFFYASFDHPIPLLPNIKIQKTNYSDAASGTVTGSLTFANKTFSASEKVTSSVTLDQIDLIPYWRILDNWVNFDIGLNFKSIEGNIEVNSATQNANEDFSVIIPMLYTKARFDMPFTGLSVETDLSYIGYAGNKIYDFKAGIVYETEIGLGATAGYRKENITLDDVDEVYSNINIQGIYAGIFYHF